MAEEVACLGRGVISAFMVGAGIAEEDAGVGSITLDGGVTVGATIV